jgi:hypothetical protein
MDIVLEVGLPIYACLDGPALETDWIMTAGLQYAFEGSRVTVQR